MGTKNTRSTEAVAKDSSTASIISAVIALSVSYAVLRYHIVGPVPWRDFPMFILNKGLCLAGFVLLVMNFSLGPAKNSGVSIPQGWLNARKAIGMTGFMLVMLHVLMSFLLFSRAYYDKFFASDGTFTVVADWSMLFGICAFVVLWVYNMSFQTFLREDKAFIKFITSRTFLLFALLLGAAHLFFMGIEGWLAPSTWHGGLPPVSLVAFAIFAVGYAFNLLGRR